VGGGGGKTASGLTKTQFSPTLHRLLIIFDALMKTGIDHVTSI
jgi:hypothetical protein